MRGLTVLQQNVRRNQSVQVALPGYPVNSRMNLEKIAIVWINDDDQLTKRQKQELKRLMARAYTHKDNGYSDERLFGSGLMADTWNNNRTEAERKAHRATLLAGSGNALRVNGHNLPLPLTMLRHGRTLGYSYSSDKYPKNSNGEVDETHDMFWPETRLAARKFFHRKPTIVEMFDYVYHLMR